MIAIPVKTNKENTAVSTLFGKAKYFAFIENNKIEILKNEQMGGKAVANWLKNKNVDVLITSHLGEKPLSTLLKEDNHHSKNCSKTSQKLENKLQKPLYKSFIRNIHY